MTRNPLHQSVERLRGNPLFAAHIEGEDIVITGRDPYLGRTVRIEAEMATSTLNRLGHGGLVRHITAALVDARPVPQSPQTDEPRAEEDVDGEKPAGTPGLKVGDVGIEVTVDTSAALAEVDRFTQRLARAVELGDRATRLVTIGDLAAVITAASGFLGVITAPGARADSAMVGRAVHSTLVLVEQAEQLARGA